ncbi:IgGFc-binding protein-like [Hyperolius riggenbachi]|uniref:IgGFc-binding protein-like n=1 Tax=Hyperolius riggenbachi TaxID=752182 RepID=UPI0035A3CCDC
MESCGSEAYKQQSVCLALEAYALACEVEGINMTGWRSQSQCALQCPPNSHYQACPSACQSSCWEGQDTNCDPHSCYEACICEGHLKLSAWGTCVPPGECGCAFEDGYYPPGKEFMLETCTTQCRCNVSNVDCHEVQPCDVGLGYTCEQDDDEFICVPHSLVSCSLYGDSHYVRFDGKDLPRNGFCQPTVAVICTPHSGLEFFHVQMVQDRQNVPHSTAVNIVVFGKNITLNPESGHVAVDGTLVQTPYIEGNLLKIIRSGLQGFLLQSAFGLVVSYDQTGHLLVRIPESYSRGVCGLCSPVNLTSNFPCSDQCQGIRYSCSVDDIVLHRSPDYCGQLDVADGLFSNCYEQVHPMAYIEACVADLCNQTTLCSSFSSYVSACQEAGVSMEEWRSQTSCDYKCPPNSYYSLCAPSCPPVCGVSLPESCPLPCREGCVCEEGYILRDDTCVPYEGCGCYVDGQYMDAGEKFYTDQCRKECTCSGNLICNDHTCTDEEECKTVQGIRACYPKLPTCWVSGQTYHTFDGATFTAEGECLRTLLTTKCPTTELPAATDVEVQMRRLLDPESNLAVLQDSKLKISGYTILLNEDNDGVEVDGFLTPFPYSWPGMVNIAGNYTHTRIEAESGLNLIIDPSKVSITLKPPYLGNVCGLCGNANGNPSDDFENLTEDEFVSNWISYYSDEPKPFSLGMYCKLMVRVDGPFQECQLFLDAYQYYGSCLTSACSDSKEDVCQALRNFYSDCQATGATVYQWEQETTCASEGPSSTLPISLNETRVSSNSSQMASPIQPVEGCHLPLNGSFNDLYKSEGKYNCTFKIAETYSQDRNGSGWDRSIDCKLLVLGSIGTATNLSFSVSLQHIVEANRSVSNLIAEGYGMQVMLPLIADNQVLVNGVPTNIPACLSSNIKVWVDDYDFILETDSGLVVSYNPDGHLVVLVPAALQDQLLGQCAEGAGVHLLNFSREWNAKPDQCLSGVKEPFSCEVHHTGCDIFLVANGPFKDCSNLIDPKTYHQNCQKHFCESGGNEASVCNFLQASTSRCHEHGALVRPWRNETFCPFPCPEKAIYEVCTEPCRMCQGRLCPSLYCQEGCNCTDGLLWDGRNCVAPEVCGKNQTKPNLYPNKYLNCMNDSSLQPNCRLCSVDNTSISTFGYISGEHNGNGTYDVVKICDSLAEEKWRISLALTPPLPPQLSIHFNNFSIAVNTDLDVLVDGKNESLPVIVASNLYLEKTEGGFSLGWPGKMVLTFNPLGQLNIYAFQNVAAELCGACSIANSYQGDGEIFYLDPWKAEDL